MKALPQVSRDLLEAARIVERGWCQGMFGAGLGYNRKGNCLWGAVMKATDSGMGPANERERAAMKAVGCVLGVDCSNDAALWNDAPERTQAEVVKALQEAALKAAEQS